MSIYEGKREIMKKTFRETIFTLIVLLSALSFCAIKTSAAGEKGKTVTVGYYANEVFEDGSSDNDIKKGYAYEYYRKISEYTGWDYEYVYGDFVTIYKKLLAGEVDLVAGLAYTDERSSLILYPERPMGAESYGIVKHDDDRSITKAKRTLTGKNIGVLDSAIVDVLQKFLDNEHITANITKFNDYETLLSSFDKKELDVIAAEIDGIYDRNHAEVLYSFGETDYYLGVNKNKPDLLAELDAAQEQLALENPGYLSLLRNKYYSSTLSSRAFTKSESEWISSQKILRVGYLNDFLPFCKTDANGNVMGIVSDLVPDIFSELGLNGIQYEFVGYDSYDDIVDALEAEEIDAGFPLGGGLYFSEKDGLYLTNPVITTVTDIVFTEKYKGSKGATFAVCENNNLQYYYVKSNFPDAKILKYSTFNECLDAVAKGEATCTTTNGLRTSSILSARKNNSFSFMQLNESEDICFGVKIGNDGLLKLLNRGVSIIGQDYIQSLAMDYSKYMYTYSFWDFVIQYVWQIVIAFLIIIFVVNYIIFRNMRNRDRMAQEVLESKIKIEKANNDKFIFVDNITNSMREPMSKLTSLIDSCKRTDDKSKIDNNLEDMAEQSRRLITMINNLATLIKNNED